MKRRHAKALKPASDAPTNNHADFMRPTSPYLQSDEWWKENEKWRRNHDYPFMDFLSTEIPTADVDRSKIVPGDEILSAALRGDLETLQQLHESSSEYSLTTRGFDGVTAAFHATRNNDMEMMQYLKNHRCSHCNGCGLQHQRCSDGRSLIHVAASEGHVDMLRFFYEFFQPSAFLARDRSESNFVFYAALYNRVSVLKWCHRTLSPTFPSILREKDARGVTPKMMAEIRGHTASVEYLSRALSAEGEFHVKRVDKVQTAMKLGVSVKYLQAVELIQRHFRGYKGRKIGKEKKRQKMQKDGERLGLQGGLAALFSTV